MIHDLKKIIDGDDRLHEDDFKKAAQELLSKQFLMRTKVTSKRSYDLVVRYQKYFTNLMDTTNHELIVNETDGYVGVIPSNFITRMRLEETLIILVMSLLYGEKFLAQEQEDDNSVILTIEEYEDRYQQVTKRELPNKSEFKELCKRFCELSLIELNNNIEDSAAVFIRIYPTITDMLGGNALEQLAGYVMADNECELEELDDEEINDMDEEELA